MFKSRENFDYRVSFLFIFPSQPKHVQYLHAGFFNPFEAELRAHIAVLQNF